MQRICYLHGMTPEILPCYLAAHRSCSDGLGSRRHPRRAKALLMLKLYKQQGGNASTPEHDPSLDIMVMLSRENCAGIQWWHETNVWYKVYVPPQYQSVCAFSLLVGENEFCAVG